MITKAELTRILRERLPAGADVMVIDDEIIVEAQQKILEASGDIIRQVMEELYEIEIGKRTGRAV